MIKILGHEHLTVSEQTEVLEGLLDVSEGRTRSNQKDVKLEVLEDCRTRLQRARGLVRPRTAGLLIGIECSRVRDSTLMYLISFVTTRIGVELAVVQENYPTRL